MHDVAKFAIENNLSLKDAALQNKIIAENITEKQIDNILDPETYIGLAVEQAELIIKDIKDKRSSN